MNVTVENLGSCKKLVRVEVDAQVVEETLVRTTKEFRRQANLPGFRRGKAPRDQVSKLFSKEIEEEVKRRLMSESYRKAVQEQHLHVVGSPDFEEVQFARGQAYQYTVTMETAPEFELPDYKGLPVRIAQAVVTQADQDRAMTVLREQKATFLDVDRPAQRGDFVVVNYVGTCDGKPITEMAPAARGLGEQKKYWLRLEENTFLPGFIEQVLGAKTGDRRTIQVQFPADFMEPALAGRPGVYDVEILQVKERLLPELNDEFARTFGAENLEKLRDGVRVDLQNELNQKQKNAIQNQLLRTLLNRIACELPESIVTEETRTVVYDLVRENQERGISKEAIDERKDEIYNYANTNAKDRIKTAFLLSRIAEKEGIKASNDEIIRRIYQLAEQNNIRPEKLVKQIKERQGLAEIAEQIVNAKVLDFLQLHSRVEESP